MKIAFEFLDNNIAPPVGFKRINFHIIFNVKIYLTRKAPFITGGHIPASPSSMTYTSVVSRESVHIAFLLAALNNCKVLAADIGNVYLNTYTKEKIYYKAGLEWGTLRFEILSKCMAYTLLSYFRLKMGFKGSCVNDDF